MVIYKNHKRWLTEKFEKKGETQTVHELRQTRHCLAAKFTAYIQNVLKMCSDNNQRLWLLIKSTQCEILICLEAMSANQLIDELSEYLLSPLMSQL